MVDPAAEEQKDLGNQAFGKKEYEKAIEFYTAAIEIDPDNHVYHSNRSACQASLKNWESSATDAEKCVTLTPSFIKGYYRLATAQMELGLLDDGLATVKKGLAMDIDNTQLLKLQRSIKQKKLNARRDAAAAAKKKQEEAKQTTNGNNNNNNMSNGRTLSAAANKELYDIQQQYITTSREYNVVKANLTKSQREQKVNSITISELEKVVEDKQKSDVKMYRGIGKMFMLSDQDQVMEYLKADMEEEKKRELEMTSKMEYLEKRMKSQQNNIQELIRGA